MKWSSPLIDRYIDTNHYQNFYDNLAVEKRKRFNIFALRCIDQVNLELDDFEKKTVYILMMKHYFMM